MLTTTIVSRLFLRNKLGWLVLFLIALPNLILYFGLSTSLAFGTVVASVFNLFGTFCARLKLSNVIAIKLNSVTFVIFIVAAVLSHFLVASLIVQTDLERAAISVVLLVVFIFSASGFASFLANASNDEIHILVWLISVWMTIVVLNYYFGFTIPGMNASIKPMFPFVEPSHFALSMMPFFIYMVIFSKSIVRIFLVLAVTAVALSIQNMTLLLGCLMVVFMCMNFKHLFIYLFIAWVLTIQSDVTYFADRANIFSDNSNLSALVYLQGWQLIGESFMKTSGWGLGFQQMGVFATEVPAFFTIESILGSGLNLKDGGFLLSKFTSEFGVIGIFLILIYFKSALNAFIHLRHIALRPSNVMHSIVISYCFIIGFAFEVLIRGSGYFTPSALFALAAIIYLHRIRLIMSKKFSGYVKI
jgi:hypothetical protein